LTTHQTRGAEALSPRRSHADDDVVIIGAGFAGLAMGIRLKQAGIENFTILERASAVGGTWRENHYPGAACDVQSYLYSYSFEPHADWTRMFAPQAEILAYLERCVERYALGPHLRFDTSVESATFDERRGVWSVRTAAGAVIRARVVVSGCGPLNRPALPEIPGLASFAGTTFHSSRWDHAYPLDGKTVGVVGTGASAIQIVPSIAPRVGRMHLFQRTPPWIVPKPDRAISPRTQALFRRFPALQRAAREAIYWQRELFALGIVYEPRAMKLLQKLALRYLAASVPDPALRAKLTPDYLMGCKRILPTNDYYPALQRANVEVVTDGIREVSPRGIVTRDGTERPLDALVLATGFEASESLAPFAVCGRRGQDLNTAWRRGAEAYLGTTAAGFPNLFMIVGPNTGLGHSSMILMIESQVQYVLDCVRTMRARGLKLVDVRPEVQTRYNARLQARLARTAWASGCKSWYQTRDGKNTTLWPGFTFEFRFRTRRFDAENYDVVPHDDASLAGPHDAARDPGRDAPPRASA
jgi:cation diffusion facilitator CzcD-associated flavoprotein CzcO